MQYLLIAEQISFRNNRLSAINIWDNFSTFSLPCKFVFDMACICGPTWKSGEYDLKFKAIAKDPEPIAIGGLKAVIKNESSVFNALAPEISLVIEKKIPSINFVVEVNDQEILSRNVPIIYIPDIQNQNIQEKKEEQQI